jgi:hypothetical protein
LLGVLTLPDAEQARAIGELHQRSGGDLVELLMDLEADLDGEQLRAWFVAALRRGLNGH